MNKTTNTTSLSLFTFFIIATVLLVSSSSLPVANAAEYSTPIEIIGDNILNNPYGIVVDSLDNVYVTGLYSNNVFKIPILIESTITSKGGSNGNGGGNANKHLTKPTFGIDHKTYIQKIKGGFTFNDKSFDITHNFWTPFEQQAIKIGETNIFSAKVFAEQKLRVQEFLFGIPAVGDAHLAELHVEIHYDYTGEIEKINVIQKTDIIDKNSLTVDSYPSNCLPDETEEKCITTLISMKFLEPLRDSVMAIKAIDYKNRYIITYINDGFDISGYSLNPMNTMQIPGTEKYEGLITVTQIAKYSDVWIADDGREFQRNESGTFTQINESFERHIDKHVIKNRTHSEFSKLIEHEIIRATQTLSQQPCKYYCYEDTLEIREDLVK